MHSGQVKIIGLVLLFISLSSPKAAETTRLFIGWDGFSCHPPHIGHQVGLAFSGGGARGLAQIGVLKALEESGLKVAAIAGTSIGGVIGGLYASGYTSADLEKIVDNIDFAELFSNRPPRTSMFLTQRPEKDRFLLSLRFNGVKPYIPPALTAGQKLSSLLARLTLKADYISGGDFSRLEIPFRAVTTDIVTGDKIVLSGGNLADAMRSTMAFPLAFTGVESGKRLLMDGGIVDPVPVDVVKSMRNDLDLVIAVNTTSALLPKEEINNPVDIANQVTSIMTLDKLKTGLEEADIIIAPDLTLYSSTDFGDVDKIIDLGYEAGRQALANIYAKLQRPKGGDSICIASVSISGNPPPIDTAEFPVSPGMVIEAGDLELIAGYLYNSYNLFSLSMEVTYRENRTGNCRFVDLTVSPVPRPDKNKIDFDLKGNRVVDDSTIINLIKGSGGNLSSEELERFSDSLMSLYKSMGYDLAHIRRLTFFPEENRLEVEIDEAIIEEIRITGNRRTKRWLIRSNLPFRENEPLNSRNIARGIANIYSTDLFDRVILNILPGNSGAIVRIGVEEKKYMQVRCGWHWDDEYRSEGYAELLHDNLLGTGQEFLIHARYSSRRRNYEISLKADRFFSTYLTYNIKGFYNLLDRKHYDSHGDVRQSIRENRHGLEFILGQQISRFGTVTGEIRWEEIKNKYDPGGYRDLLQLRTITLRSLAETINRYPFPTEGKKHLFYVKFSADILGGETEFTKFFSSVESYFPLTEKLNFHPRVSIGYTDTKSGLPLSENFYIGGHYSFYGYATDELAGAKALLANIELRYKLPFRLYASGRYDVGNVYSTVDQIKLGNLRQAFGLSLAYDSPIGPIDIGYGKSGVHPDRLYFDIGLAF
jgi:NTE family protein